MAEGDEGGAGGEAEVVVVAVAEEEATLPSFMVHRYPSMRRRMTCDLRQIFKIYSVQIICHLFNLYMNMLITTTTTITLLHTRRHV